MSSNSGLWEPAKTDLMRATVHQGQQAFLDHPVTKGVISSTTFVASGGIEGIVGLASLGRTLVGNLAKGGTQGIKSLGAATKGFSKTINFGKIKVPAETFHRQIKPNILSKAGDFSRAVGKNPDIKIVNGKIKLTGTGPFKGKSFDTGLDAIDFFGGF